MSTARWLDKPFTITWKIERKETLCHYWLRRTCQSGLKNTQTKKIRSQNTLVSLRNQVPSPRESQRRAATQASQVPCKGAHVSFKIFDSLFGKTKPSWLFTCKSIGSRRTQTGLEKAEYLSERHGNTTRRAWVTGTHKYIRMEQVLHPDIHSL